MATEVMAPRRVLPPVVLIQRDSGRGTICMDDIADAVNGDLPQTLLVTVLAAESSAVSARYMRCRVASSLGTTDRGSLKDPTYRACVGMTLQITLTRRTHITNALHYEWPREVVHDVQGRGGAGDWSLRLFVMAGGWRRVTCRRARNAAFCAAISPTGELTLTYDGWRSCVAAELSDTGRADCATRSGFWMQLP